MAGGLEMIPDPKFREVVRRFKNESQPLTSRTITGLISQLQKKTVMTAREELKRLVYDAELPKSVEMIYPGGATPYWTTEQYMAERRLGRAWRAVKAKKRVIGPAVGYGDVVVDRTASFQGYYYAWILNNGSDGTIDYAPRPFWKITAQKMRAEMRASGLVALAGLKMGYLGNAHLPYEADESQVFGE